MPHLHILAAGGNAQRRLLDSTIADYTAKGYEDVRKQEGGDWLVLLSENRGGGLFDEKSLIIVEDAEKMGPLPDSLSDLLDPPGAECVVLLLAKSESSSVIPKSLIAKCTLSKAADPSPWSRDRDDAVLKSAKKYGVSVSKDAVSLMKELFEDMGELESESEKLANYCSMTGQKSVTQPLVETFCMSDGSKNLLKLLDGLCGCKRNETIHCLAAMQAGSELLPLLSALHNRLRVAFHYAANPDARAQFSKAFGVRDYAARQADNAAKLYGKEALLRFTIGLICINANEKSGRGAGWRDLNMLVIDLLSSGKQANPRGYR